jgi:hypothetical protein
MANLRQRKKLEARISVIWNSAQRGVAIITDLAHRPQLPKIFNVWFLEILH